MKQIKITPEIEAQLKAALGPDVDVSNFAVFESISLNDQPLPGKRGRIFEKAVTPASTLLTMVRSINDGNHLPLMIDHNLEGAPKGRAFHAGLNFSDSGQTELRTLFYIDPTETDLIAKVNNGTYDEVSVQFLAEKILCSDCGFDFRGPDATFENLLSRTDPSGHEMGVDGAHARLIGLESFVELSLVARGAAKNPKIVGKSSSKLAPETVERLAAQGFEDLDGLICQVSLGEDTVSIDVNKLVADLSAANGDLKVATGEATALKAQIGERDNTITALTGERDTALADVTRLEGELTAAKAASKEDEATAAVTYLTSVLKAVRTASGKEEGEIPATVAELTAAIDADTSKLTAILPVGGRGKPATTNEDNEGVRDFGAFKTA